MDHQFELFGSCNMDARGSNKGAIWATLWRRIKKEKKRMFQCSNTTSSMQRFTYDQNSYSQNFDQGLMWSDQDDLSRSFSARFAHVPSRIFRANTLIMV